MAKIVIAKNTTAYDISLGDLSGYTVPASGTRTLSDIFTFDRLVDALDLYDAVSSGTIVINDGNMDLSAADSTRYISYEDAESLQGFPLADPETASISGGWTIKYNDTHGFEFFEYDPFAFADLEDVTINEYNQYVIQAPTESGVPPAALQAASLFTSLLDVPSTYSGSSGRYLRVGTTESGIEFTSVDDTESLESKWFTHFINDTPSKKIRIFGQSANGFNPGYDIRILELRVQYYSEHSTLSDIRVRVHRYDANAATDRLILSVQEVEAPVGYRSLSDTTPDTDYYNLDSGAGDTIWVEVEDTSGQVIKKTSEITINVKYKAI